VFNVNMESFDGVQVCSFLMVMYYLHYVVDGAKGVCIVLEVLCKIGSTAVVVNHVFNFEFVFCCINIISGK